MLAVLSMAVPTAGQVVPKCTAAKLKYEGIAAAKVLKCYTRAAGKHEAVDPECLQKALTKLDEWFIKAEGDGPCYGGSAFRAPLVTEAETGIASALYPAGLLFDAEFECASSKLKAAAKLASKSTSCHAKAAKKATVVDPECLQKASAKFNAAFQDAETVGGCAANGNAAAVSAYVDQLTDSTAALLTADTVPIRCCAATATTPFGPLTGCADLVLGRCTTAAFLLSSIGGTATQGSPGKVCDGAIGACAAAPTGTSTCCEASKNGQQICAEGPSLAASGFRPACDGYGNPGGVTFTRHDGQICKDGQYLAGNPNPPLPHCE